MRQLDKYFELQGQIFAYFGYVEDWRVIPLDDSRDYYWVLDGEGPGTVTFAETEEQLETDGDYYRDEVYMQRFLPRWVYRGNEYTMIAVDTHTDGNQLLRIFDNSKERAWKEEERDPHQ